MGGLLLAWRHLQFLVGSLLLLSPELTHVRMYCSCILCFSAWYYSLVYGMALCVSSKIGGVGLCLFFSYYSIPPFSIFSLIIPTWFCIIPIFLPGEKQLCKQHNTYIVHLNIGAVITGCNVFSTSHILCTCHCMSQGAIITCTTVLLYCSSAAIYHMHGVYRFVHVPHPGFATCAHIIP